MARTILSFEDYNNQIKSTQVEETEDVETCEVCDNDPCTCETTGMEDDEEIEDEEIDDEDEDDDDEDDDDEDEDDEDEDDDEDDEKKETVSESIKKCYEMAVDEACNYEGDDYPEHTVETYMKEMASLNASMAAETFEKACSKVREGDLTIEMYEAACNEMKDTFAKRIDELKEAWAAK